MADITFDPVDVARQFLYVREAQAQGQNRGLRVEGIQHWAMGTFGDSWCDEFAVGFVLDICFQGDSPFPRQSDVEDSTEATRAYAEQQGWLTDAPAVGDLVLSLDPATGRAHHVGIVTVLDPLTSIAGNTSEDGVSSNGDRVAEHVISASNKTFVHYPR